MTGWLLSFVLLFLQAAPQTSTGVVQGTITRAGSAELLRDVRVTLIEGSIPTGLPPDIQLQLAPGRSAVSDDKGLYVFTDVPAGRYSLVVQREGFSGSSSNTSSIVVTAGSRIEVNLALTPGAVIRGRILDSSGQFVANVTVQALAISYQDGFPALRSTVSKVTDDRGEYRLFGVPPGDYYIAVAPRPPIVNTAPTSGTVRSVRTFYPSSTVTGAATRVTVNGGEEITGIDIAIQSKLHVRVSGRVVSQVRPPPPDPDAPGLFAIIANTQNNSAQLFLVPRDSNAAEQEGRSGIPVLLNDSSGEFQIPSVVPGSYDLFAMASGQQGLALGRTPVDVFDQDVTGVTIVATGGVEVKGTVVVDGQTTNNPVTRISLEPIDSLARIYPGFGSRTQPDEPGTFSFTSVPVGRFRVSVVLPNSLYVEDVLQNNRSVFDSGFEVRSGDSPDPLQIVVRSGAGSVTGMVLDSAQKPLSGATIALVPNTRRANTNLYRSATSDAAGRFTISGVAPDGYKLFAWPGPVNGAYINSEFLGRYEDDGRAITVTPGSRITSDVSAVHGQSR